MVQQGLPEVQDPLGRLEMRVSRELLEIGGSLAELEPLV